MQTAIPILIGTKFDDFVRLPPDLQWTIATQVKSWTSYRITKIKIILLFRTHCLTVSFSIFIAKKGSFLVPLCWKKEKDSEMLVNLYKIPIINS